MRAHRLRPRRRGSSSPTGQSSIGCWTSCARGCAGEPAARERHAALAGRLARAPGLLLAERRAGFEPLAARLHSSLTRLVERRRAEVAALGGRLHALSPAATLDRGYAIVTSRGRVVRAALAVSPGEPLHVRLARGHLEARVESVASETPGPGDAQVP
jgi:exonuclease VII large subunit